MINLIGYPDWIYDSNALTKYYENVGFILFSFMYNHVIL